MACNHIRIITENSITRSSLQEQLSRSFPDVRVISKSINSENASAAYSEVVVWEIQSVNALFLKQLKEENRKGNRVLVLTDLQKITEADFLQLFKSEALDVLQKPSNYSSLSEPIFQQELLRKINYLLTISGSAYMQLLQKRHSSNSLTNRYMPYDLVVIGGSTGATDTIAELTQSLVANFPTPVVLVQHLPKNFTYKYANRLGQNISNRVCIPQNREPLQPYSIYLLASDTNKEIAGVAENLYFEDTKKEFQEHNNPSFDGFLLSIDKITSRKTLVFILSGMGKDGAEGAKMVKNNGGRIVIQQPEECLAESMPLSTKSEVPDVEIMTAFEMKELLQSIPLSTSLN